VTLADAKTSDLVAFLVSLTGELHFATVPSLPPGNHASLSRQRWLFEGAARGRYS
jgi:hypothetical protein